VLDHVAATVTELLLGAQVEAVYAPAAEPAFAPPPGPTTAAASDMGPPGWRVELRVVLRPGVVPFASERTSLLREVGQVVPSARRRSRDGGSAPGSGPGTRPRPTRRSRDPRGRRRPPRRTWALRGGVSSSVWCSAPVW